jgi:hypothetical protein
MKFFAQEMQPSGAVLAPYLSPEELADQLQVCLRTLHRWDAARVGPPRVLIGRRVMYRRAAVEAWLIARERGFDDDKKKRPRGKR